MRKTTLIVLGIAALAVACNKSEEFGAARQAEPKLPEQPYNYKNQQFAAYQWTVDNQLSDVTDAKATLGRVLFFDTKLSVNNAISCGSCHKQNVAFADMGQFSSGFRGVQTKRNSPPTFNVAMNGQLCSGTCVRQA
jgi:cytochrome c peroxidase